MILINLIIPYKLSDCVDLTESEDFIIINKSTTNRFPGKFFIIKTTEQEMTALVLKLGKENVWYR